MVAIVLNGCQAPWEWDGSKELVTQTEPNPSVEISRLPESKIKDTPTVPSEPGSLITTNAVEDNHKRRMKKLDKVASRNSQMQVREMRVKPGQTEGEVWDGNYPVARVSYDDKVFFDFDRYSIRPDGVQVLRELAEFLGEELGTTTVLVVGHTDSKGLDVYNLQLSERRALAVVDFFKKFSLVHIYFEYSGVGETQPAASNSTEPTRALNRRVEFFISGNKKANSRALVETPFDPCHWNDHPGALKNEGTVKCSTKTKLNRVVIKEPEGRSTKGRGERSVKLPRAQLDRIEEADRRAAIILASVDRERLRRSLARPPLNMLNNWGNSALPRKIILSLEKMGLVRQ